MNKEHMSDSNSQNALPIWRRPTTKFMYGRFGQPLHPARLITYTLTLLPTYLLLNLSYVATAIWLGSYKYVYILKASVWLKLNCEADFLALLPRCFLTVRCLLPVLFLMHCLASWGFESHISLRRWHCNIGEYAQLMTSAIFSILNSCVRHWPVGSLQAGAARQEGRQ